MSVRLTLGFVLALACFCTNAEAIPAPSLSWHTFENDCCIVHFHDEVRTQAERVLQNADAAVALSSALLGSRLSQKINIVVSDATDSANGWATSVPYNLVHLFVVSPTRDSDLAKNDDYLRMLMLHEILHIVHLDNIRGLPSWVNLFMGKLWAPNFVLPRWMHEGIAVYAETRFTDGGRLRSPHWRAQLRAMADAGDLFALDDLSTFSRRPPAGNAAYLFGGSFMAFASNTYGEKWLQKFNQGYAERAIPYSISRTFEDATGVSLEQAWADFMQAIRDESAAAKNTIAARQGQSPARRLTRLGGSFSKASFGKHDDGTSALVFTASSPNQTTGLFAMQKLPAETQIDTLSRVSNVDDVAAISARSFLVVQREIVENRFNFGDLYALTLDEKGTVAKKRITRGLRVHSPVVANENLAYAIARSGSLNRILRIDLMSQTYETLLRFDAVQVPYGLALSPDQKTLAFTLDDKSGARDVVLYDLQNKTKQRLAFPGDSNDVAYHPSGNLLFTSDVDGVFNIFEYDQRNERFNRVSDLALGAFAPTPTPDGKALVIQSQHIEGNDLYVIPYEPRLFVPQKKQSLSALFIKRNETSPWPKTKSIEPKSTRYNPIKTLLPRRWFPLLATDSKGGPRVGFALDATDAIEGQRLATELSLGLTDQRPRVSLSYDFMDTYFPLSLRASWLTQERENRVIEGEAQPDVQQIFKLDTTVAFRLRRFLRSHRFSLTYTRELRIGETKTLGEPSGQSPRLPTNESVAPVALRWSYSDIQRFRDSVADEEGLAMSATFRLANAFTLSDVDVAEASLNLRLFKPVPGLSGHTFGGYATAAFATGPRDFRSIRALGGFGERDIIRDFVDGVRFGGGQLRGYPRGISSGDGSLLFNLEYRFPIFDAERGIATLPLFFQRVSGAFFSDVGQAFSQAPDVQTMRASLGLEARLDFVFGYYGQVRVRAGYARGLHASGIDQPYLIVGVPY